MTCPNNLLQFLLVFPLEQLLSFSRFLSWEYVFTNYSRKWNRHSAHSKTAWTCEYSHDADLHENHKSEFEKYSESVVIDFFCDFWDVSRDV